jgi:hypothetical protein
MCAEKGSLKMGRKDSSGVNTLGRKEKNKHRKMCDYEERMEKTNHKKK